MSRRASVTFLAFVLTLNLSVGPTLAAAAQLTREEQALPPPAMSAQGMTPEEEARLLLGLARRLEDRGEVAATRLVLQDILERYDGTESGTEARERLRLLPANPPPVPAPPAAAPPGPGSSANPGTRTTPGPRSSRTGAGLDQSGRVPVIVYSTLLSSYLAISIPIVADAEGSQPYGLALLAGAPIGLLSSIYLTRHRQVTAAQADLFMLAGNWGLFHGLAFGIISDGDGKDVAGSAALGGFLGAGMGAMLAAPGRNRESSVALASLGTTYGAWLGLVASQLSTKGEDSPSDNRAFTGMMIGGDVALGTAVLVGPGVTLSRSRSRLIGLGGTGGALIGLAFDLIFKVDGRQAAWGMVGAGTLAGLAGGVALTSDYDSNRGFTDPGIAELRGIQLGAPGLVPRRGGVGLELVSARF